MPIASLRVRVLGASLMLLAAAPLAAQRSTAVRDSIALEQQARLIARLDSQLTALRREVRARNADTTRAQHASEPPVAPALARIGGLLQLWYAQGDGGFQSTFRIRRAELKLTGDLSSQTRWAITVDLARALTLGAATTDINGVSVVTGTSVNQSSRILVDALMALAIPGGNEIDVGQFKIPLGLEGGVQSPALLETVERAQYTSDRARGGNYGDSRDIGVLVRAPSGANVEYQVGVFNGLGESQNDVDHNGAKALTGRLVVRVPFLRQLALGGSGAFATRSAPDSLIRQRVGAEARFAAGPLFLKSEYMAGRDILRRGAGWYAHVGYSVTPRLNLIAREDVFDPNLEQETDILNASERDWITGFTYEFAALNVRLQMNYLRKTFSPLISPSRNLLLTNLQAAW